MICKLTSIENGPKRNVEIVVTGNEVRSAISSPAGSIDPRGIDHNEVSGLQQHETRLVTLALVLKDGQRVRFYSTESKFDMVFLLDQLDGAIGERRRDVVDARGQSDSRTTEEARRNPWGSS
jgi:hypothetical protein